MNWFEFLAFLKKFSLITIKIKVIETYSEY